MSEYICFLVTVLCRGPVNGTSQLLRTALKIHQDDLPAKVFEFPEEPDSRKIIHDLLPPHAQGEIVEVTRDIFEVHVVERKPKPEAHDDFPPDAMPLG
jgi:hypothetical protein